jgi:hypothetical protein
MAPVIAAAAGDPEEDALRQRYSCLGQFQAAIIAVRHPPPAGEGEGDDG